MKILNPIEKSWLVKNSAGAPAMRLYCFSYAGGNAMNYLPWQARLDPAIEICAVQLPGRSTRFHEPAYTEMEPLVSELLALMHHNEMPFAVFGHSLGGLLAFELTRRLQAHGRPLPLHLFVSGCHAPRFRSPGKGLSRVSDDQLIEELKKYNGTPPELFEYRDLLNMLLPTIRADFALVDDYRYVPGAQLDVPMTVLAGRRDTIESPEQVEGWAVETSRGCQMQWFDGDHFFIQSERDSVIDCIASTLAPSLRASPMQRCA